MVILMRQSRAGRRVAAPSVREVCLLGVSRPDASWASGDRLAWGGRSYRVEATQSPPALEGPGAEGGLHYVYLSASGAGAGRPVG